MTLTLFRLILALLTVAAIAHLIRGHLRVRRMLRRLTEWPESLPVGALSHGRGSAR